MKEKSAQVFMEIKYQKNVLSVIIIDSVFGTGENYYSQVFFRRVQICC